MDIRTRIPFPVDEQMSADQRRVRDMILQGPRGGVRGPLRLLLHSPDVAERVQALGEVLRWKTSLSPRLTEVAILKTARHLGATYVWTFHVNLALRDGLLDNTQIGQISEGAAMPVGLSEAEAAFCRFVDELLDRHAVDDETLAAMTRNFGKQGVIDTVAVVGYYHIGGLLVNVAGLEVLERN